ncbi:TetR/AcrR family transcriptional regulator [Nocardia sp. NPDC087230]|uniref:TetR/AcrR family transcriptional regulator n=1 Tax=Nocardia sp. NPDC087230 TaxID=3364331 RepID=UPI00381868D6
MTSIDSLAADPPRAVLRARRRRYLLAAAGEVFARQGYHAATMDEIAHRAGFSKPTVYVQFPSKLALYLEVLQHHIDDLIEVVRTALRSTTGNRARVHAVVAAYFDFVDHNSVGYHLIFESDATIEPSVQWRVGNAIDACVTAAADLIAHDGDLDPFRARMLAVGMVGASRSGAAHWVESNREIPKAVAVRLTAELCWGGLAGIPLRDDM